MGFAELRRERTLGGTIALRRWEASCAIAYPANAHDHIEIAWVERGAARYRIASDEVLVSDGMVMAVPAGVEHRTEFLGPLAASSVRLSAALVQQVCDAMQVDLARSFQHGLLAAPEPMLRLLRSLAAELADMAELADTERPGDDLLADALGQALAVQLVRRAAPPKVTIPDARVRRAVELIESRYADPLRLDDLADAAGLSRFHFARVFAAATGCSPYQYLLRTRIRRALSILQCGRMSVTDTAYAVGFTDLGRFQRAFRAELGVSPRDVKPR